MPPEGLASSHWHLDLAVHPIFRSGLHAARAHPRDESEQLTAWLCVLLVGYREHSVRRKLKLGVGLTPLPVRRQQQFPGLP